MLKFICLVTCAVAVVSGYRLHHHHQPQEEHHQPQPEIHHHKVEHHEEHVYEIPHDYYAHAKYKFDYGVQDPHTGDHKTHWEERDGDVVRGAYTIFDSDGSTRIVEYTADPLHGFNAVVKKVQHEPLVQHEPEVKHQHHQHQHPVYEHGHEHSHHE
ncbi:larval cuticle protein A2B-like [Malaya genurostris]|uniref:larval cuticle protein A2B-like n=1 Tax=Malaya genurostris TaxID=325434 RepID=UPI0026F3D187|nr:larval cuticle protein A2B-like [Malaya genurostris]